MEQRLSISKVAAAYKITARTLRFYEEAGLLTSHRKEAAYREYDEAQCRRLEIILFLRHLSFSVKEIALLLQTDENNAGFQDLLRAKIVKNSRLLLEAWETDRLLRDFEAELAAKPTSEISVAEMLSKYGYLTKRTERMIKMDEMKYCVLLGHGMIRLVEEAEAFGHSLSKVGQLRADLGERGIILPTIRFRDDINLYTNEISITWDGEQVWLKDYSGIDPAACADEILEQIKYNATK